MFVNSNVDCNLVGTRRFPNRVNLLALGRFPELCEYSVAITQEFVRALRKTLGQHGVSYPLARYSYSRRCKPVVESLLVLDESICQMKQFWVSRLIQWNGMFRVICDLKQNT